MPGTGAAIGRDMENKNRALKTGDNTFDFDSLDVRDLLALRAMGCAGLDGWIRLADSEARKRLVRSRPGADFEALILEAQEDEGRNVG